MKHAMLIIVIILFILTFFLNYKEGIDNKSNKPISAGPVKSIIIPYKGEACLNDPNWSTKIQCIWNSDISDNSMWWNQHNFNSNDKINKVKWNYHIDISKNNTDISKNIQDYPNIFRDNSTNEYPNEYANEKFLEEYEKQKENKLEKLIKNIYNKNPKEPQEKCPSLTELEISIRSIHNVNLKKEAMDISLNKLKEISKVKEPEPLTCSSLKCVADFGTNIGENLCCGQSGVLENTDYVCPSVRPKCMNYKCGSKFGTCV